MKRYKLCICIPTYNRGMLFVDDIREILTLKNDNFCIRIIDNCSTDGSFECLSQIDDERLIVEQNEKNIGGIKNTMKCVSNINFSDYILFCLDKDKVIPDKLIEYINFLDEVQPTSGYIDLYSTKSKVEVRILKKGVQAVKNTGYLSKHPSGFFWKTEVFNRYLQNTDLQSLQSFPFWMDVLQGKIAMDYDSCILYKPIIIHAPFRKDYMINRPKTLTYNSENIYFSLENRIVAFSIFLDSMNECCKSNVSNILLTYHMLVDLHFFATVGLKRALADKGNCWHYNIEPRVVGNKELFNNVKTVNLNFKALYKTRIAIIKYGIINLATVKILLYILIQQFISFIKNHAALLPLNKSSLKSV